MKNVLSLGAGIQSSALLLMSCRGLLPKLDAAVFADTQWEPPAVYRVLEWLKEEAARHGIPVEVVTAGDLREHTLKGVIRGKKGDGERYASLPVRVLQPDGSNVMMNRQCTREYKIDPVAKWLRYNAIGLKPRQRMPKDASVDLWMGISLDEIGRMKPDPRPWINRVWPLVGMPQGTPSLGKAWTRADCIRWLDETYPGQEFVRSACIGCPYRSPREWQDMKDDPTLWNDAVEVDEAIRYTDKQGGQVFLHRSCVPLKDVDLHGDPNQTDLFGEECEGGCGL